MELVPDFGVPSRAMMTSRYLPLALVLAAACGGGGGGSTVDLPTASYEGPVTSSDTAGGESIWAANCAGCHSEQEGAYGPRVHDLALSPARMREQIREGSGRMPGFGAGEISDTDLENLLAYLQSIHGVAAPAPATATP